MTTDCIPAPRAAAALRRTTRGDVLVPGDAGYEARRVGWRESLDQRPAAIVDAATPGDVQAALVIAREHELELAVMGVGHGAHVPSDGGLLVRTTRLNEVEVDPRRRTARVGAGASWDDVIAAAVPFGLAPLSGSHGSVGVAGYTLGGGLGLLSRRFGYAADSLVRADVVTADGALVSVTAETDADLFWALRGAGTNFAVATALEVRLFPVAEVYGGSAVFAGERAAETLAALRDHADRLPDALSVAVVLRGPVFAIRGLYAGGADAAAEALRPLWEAAGAPLTDGFRTMLFAETEAIGDTEPAGFSLHDGLSDAAIADMVAAVEGDDPAAEEVEVRLWGGAMARGGEDAGPAGPRQGVFGVTVDGPPAVCAALARHASGRTFLNFLREPTGVEDAYAPADLRRLRELKRLHDPDNVLGRNRNIAPAIREPQPG